MGIDTALLGGTTIIYRNKNTTGKMGQIAKDVRKGRDENAGRNASDWVDMIRTKSES